MPKPVSFGSSLLVGSALIASLVATSASARPREVDKPLPCPTDAPVLVGAEGSASRFSALSGCSDVRVIPQADAAALNDHDPGSYVVRETARDENGEIQGPSYYHSADLKSRATPESRHGDVKVIRDYTAAGTPLITIAQVDDHSAAQDLAETPRRDVDALAPRRRAVAPRARPPEEAPQIEQAPLNIASVPTPMPAVASTDERLLDLRADRVTPFDREIAEVARRQRVDPLLLHAVIKRESAYRATVVSRAGAVGAMQMMPGTGRMLGLAPAHLRNPRANIEAGARLLRRLAGVYKGNFELVLAAYNAGEGAVRKYGNRIPPYAETQAYVRAVLGEYGRLASAAGIVMGKAR